MLLPTLKLFIEMSLTPKELEHLKEVIRDLTLQSHQSISEGSSKYWGEMKTEIALIKQLGVERDRKLDEILEQTKRTNGRVNSLEKWQSSVIGATTILAGIGAYLAYGFLKLQNEVSAHIGVAMDK